jgi:hypothetical protein
VRNLRAGWPFSFYGNETLALFRMPADGGIRRRRCPGAAAAGDAAGPNRAAVARARQRMRADAVRAPTRCHASAGHDNRGNPRTARRQTGAVRRRIVSASGRRSANACADARYRQHPGDPSARQSRRQSQHAAEITALCGDFSARTGGAAASGTAGFA